MDITLEIIQIIDAIDRNGNFETAANELHKVRSALTYTIKKFEDRLGVKIFNRSEHKAKLTLAGKNLLDQGRELLNSAKNIEANIKNSAKGWEANLRIAYDEIINDSALFEILQQFSSECPNVNLDIYTEILDGCVESLANDRVDIVIGATQPLPNRSDLIFEPLGKTKFVFAISPQHPLAKLQEPLSIRTIKKYPAMLVRDTSKSQSAKSLKIDEQPYITYSTLALKRKALLNGLGVGFIPYIHIVEDIKSGRLIVKKCEKQRPACMCYIGWNSAKTGKAQRWFIKKLLDKNIQNKLIK